MPRARGGTTAHRIALTACCVALACVGRRPGDADVGKPAPPYGARTLQGDSVVLARFAGEPLLLNVWATWCDPCREEIPFLEKIYRNNHGRGLHIVGVSVDARGQERHIGEFASEMGMTYPIWLDPDWHVTQLFLAFGVPASYLVDRRGLIRWKHVGVLRPTNEDFMAALDAVLKGDATP